PQNERAVSNRRRCDRQMGTLASGSAHDYELGRIMAYLAQDPLAHPQGGCLNASEKHLVFVADRIRYRSLVAEDPTCTFDRFSDDVTGTKGRADSRTFIPPRVGRCGASSA